MIKIVLDASGGDYAPAEIVKGAYLAGKELGSNVEIVLAGRTEQIISCIKQEKLSSFSPQIIDAPGIIAMDEPGALSIRKKRDSSIVKGLQMLKDKQADAFVSCGNTAAVVSGAVLGLRLIEGIERPGIGIVFPTKTGSAFMLDVGANIDAKPSHLFQYAIMAEVYSEKVLGKVNPSIGILNIGEEDTKGTDFIKETRLLFEKADFNFFGNVEPKDIFEGVCDCVVCDGFVGNIALKISEGVAEIVAYFLKKYLKQDILGRMGLLFSLGALKRFKKKIDYSEYGGAPLLGIDGVVIIGHGRSDAYAVKNAIKVARWEVERDINQEISQRVKQYNVKVN